MSKVEMTKIGVPNWLKNTKVLKGIDQINDEIEELTLSTAGNSKAERQSLLDAAMAGEISATEFTKRFAKIKDTATQNQIDVATVRLLKAKKALAPKIRELANSAAKDWEREASEQERMIKDSLAKLDLREAERHAVLATEKTLRRLRETARGVKASGDNFWTSGDSQLLTTIEQRLRQSLGLFHTSN